ncbi:MAG: cytochrome b N-terminal domain-containing protein [candidate division WOR-3 bacterium]
MNKIKEIWRSLTWSFDPKDKIEATKATSKNFWLHWFPARVTYKSMSWTYSFWLGTVLFSLFLILTITGVILMFLYIPSAERAYWTIKDLENSVSFGWFLRNAHRWAAHLMVTTVFLHMMRVFFTGAYKNGGNPESNRPLNWIVGVILLVLTLGLSYTGYLLPWDQLALWAIVIGANIAKSVPPESIVGKNLYFFLAGGTQIDQPTLIRFYVLHCIFLPLLLLILSSYHMWRVRKDGGLAVSEQYKIEAKKLNKRLIQDEYTTFTIPFMFRRAFLVFLITTAIVLFFTIFAKAPLEEPADPTWTPNPAKAPWYFLWIQELIAITTIKIGDFTINGGFIGGALIPALLVFLWAIWPYLDKSPDEATGVWFHKSRIIHNVIFAIIMLYLIGITIFAMYFRGPYWQVYWPWRWPEMPHMF